ncbi:hypothetical protein [Actinomadura hibisca]|uniref:hypothetical protein n=1 Tax=Actinomadura hibisca TaxID=68565 RepID=UPI000830D877|nr:hypothetical protein [Actinomadura hibisca]
MPGADELFRLTAPSPPARGPVAGPAAPPAAEHAAEPGADPGADAPAPPSGEVAVPVQAPAAPVPVVRRPTGRQRHDSKITVYVSADELLELERLRLALRAEHGLAVDRGRLVREAVAHMLAEYEARGEHSLLVRRLSDG